MGKKENWFEENIILIVILAFIVLLILIEMFSGGNGGIKKELTNNYQKEISLKEALSLCYKKAKECAKEESNLEVASYYEVALRESCLQIYSAYLEIDSSKGILKFTEDLC